MKFSLPVCVALAMLGCSGETMPTAPNPPAASPTPSASASLWGFVLDPRGSCIKDAVVEVIRGQAQGRQTIQETPCDAWSYGGGFEFKELIPGVEMTVRASAPGWRTEEKSFVPQQAAVEILLERP